MSVAEIPYPGLGGGLSLGSGGGGGGVLLLDDDTQLRIVSCNAGGPVGIGIQGLRVDSDSNAKAIVESHAPAQNRVVSFQNYKLGAGTLLRLTAFVSSGLVFYGQTYILAQLVRGVSGPTQVIATLIGGYITVNQALGFPGTPIQSSLEGQGYMRGIQGTLPGAGHDILESVPLNARWELVSANAQLTASAAPNNRTVRIVVTGQGLSSSFGLPAGQQGPNAIVNYVWGPNMPHKSGLADVSGQFWSQQSTVDAPVMLPNGGAWQTTTDNLQAGDQWTPPLYTVREWLEF